MRILITNDDGVDAPGLAILEEAARTVSDDVWVVAPATEQSGQGQAVTLVNPLRLAKLGEKRYAVAGTPADCVAIAFNVVLKDRAPDLVLSGVNQGFNIADDIGYSGTVGAATEAALRGVRSIAFSQAYRRLGQEAETDIFSAARGHCASALRRLMEAPTPAQTLLNVNFPPVAADEVAGMAIVRQGARAANEIYVDERQDNRGAAYYWLRFRRDPGDPGADTDLGAMATARIAVTPLRVDRTDESAMAPLSEALGEVAS